MIRPVVCALSACALVAIAAATQAAPTPPPPVALAYDEIVRMVIAPATPPPPGSFQPDYKLAMGEGGTVASQPQEKPKPKHRGFGNILGSVLSGENPAEAVADNAIADRVDAMAADALGASVAALRQFQNGHVTRYTYYLAKGWVREDDPVAKTATISKCNEHQFISLDLAKKTYRISDTRPKACANTPPPSAPHRTEIRNEEAGTADLTLKATGANLGPKTLEGYATNGRENTFEMASTNATGSCRNGNTKMRSTTYVSSIHRPRAYCPIARIPVPRSENDVIVHGGCKPRIHGAMSGFAGVNANLLDLYTRVWFGTASTQPDQGFNTVTQRGNIAWLAQPSADPLFTIPAGFTEEK